MPEATQAPRMPRTGVVHAVTGVHYGTLRSRKSQLFHRYEAYGEPDADADMGYFFWALQRGGDVVLVDTGFDPEVGRRRGRTPLIGQREALERLGIEPADVRTVVVTHLHYDHIGGLRQFPHAELVVPGVELEFWTSPLARHHQFASHVEAAELAYLQEAVSAGRVRATDGDETVLPGVRTLTVGGHSPGQQMVVVATARGPLLLTSDAVHFYEELERDRPFSVVVDLAAMYRAYERIRELVAREGVEVVPSHDPRVLKRYAPVSASARFAVRLGVRLRADERQLPTDPAVRGGG